MSWKEIQENGLEYSVLTLIVIIFNICVWAMTLASAYLAFRICD